MTTKTKKREAMSEEDIAYWRERARNPLVLQLIDEIDRLRAENEELREQQDKLQTDLHWYQREAVARTNLVVRRKP